MRWQNQDFGDAARTYSAFWFVDDALKGDIICWISDNIEISDNVTDFLSAVKLGSADHGIGNVGFEKGLFNRP